MAGIPWYQWDTFMIKAKLYIFWDRQIPVHREKTYDAGPLLLDPGVTAYSYSACANARLPLFSMKQTSKQTNVSSLQKLGQ